MYARHLELIDFRSYAKLSIDLESGPSVFVGPNGEGKTNILEALGYVATLSSHRVAADAPLVRAGADRAIIRATIVHEGRELLVELEIVPGKANRARLNRSPVTRSRDILGALRMVMFAPEDLALVRGDPSERRRFLDDLLVARQPRYAGVRADYERVVKQRNALLRTAYLSRKAGSGSRDLSTLDVWDSHLAQHGSELLAARLELVDSLRAPVGQAYESVSQGRGLAQIDYQSGLGEDIDSYDRGVLAARLVEALATARSQEIERGVTLVGPHRDEVRLQLGGLPVKGYASHGECWSFALALRLASFQLLRADGIEPMLALDDVFAELDTQRRERLAELVVDAGQTLVTCAVAGDVPAALQGARYDVMAGEVRRVL